jgi:multidrug efflux pump
MLGETTLAMLYVPLFFYLFDKFSERSKEKKLAAAAQIKEGYTPAEPDQKEGM